MIDENQLAVAAVSETINCEAVHWMGTNIVACRLPFIMPHFDGLSFSCARCFSVAGLGEKTACRRKEDGVCKSIGSKYAGT